MDKLKYTFQNSNILWQMAHKVVCTQKTLHLSSLLVLLGCVLLGASSCSNEELSSDEQLHEKPQPITIRLGVESVPVLCAQNTRGWTYDRDLETDGERIQSAFTLMFNDKFVIEHILEVPSANEKKDSIQLNMVEENTKQQWFKTTTGQKSFLTFVNVPREEVEALYAKKRGKTDFHFKKDQSYKSKEDSTALVELAIPVQADALNDTRPSKDKGIPMTGWTNVVLTNRIHNRKAYTVYALRMVAKLQFKFTNKTGQPLTINSIEVDRLTDDADDATTGEGGKGNIKPFPYPQTPWGPSGFSVDVRPNMQTTATQSIHTYTLDKKFDVDQEDTYSVYVNETDVPQNDFHQFKLKVNLTLADGTTKQERFALVGNENKEWNFIARNDWRVIPIVLQDYKLELVPQDFPPIGVLPAAVKEANGTFKCTFHASGAFHLKPQLVKVSTGEVVQNWTQKDPIFTTTEPNTSMYAEQPSWSTMEGCIHGSFVSGQSGSSVHTLTLTCTPQGGVERIYVAPVIINKEQ